MWALFSSVSLNPLNLSSMLKVCFRDHVASIFLESLETYFSELLSWFLNHPHFPAVFGLCFSLPFFIFRFLL